VRSFYILFLLIFSTQISAQNNFYPTHITMISPQVNAYQNTKYHDNIPEPEIKTCELEEEGFFTSLFPENDDSERTFMGIELDYIEFGLSLVSIGVDFIIPGQ